MGDPDRHRCNSSTANSCRLCTSPPYPPEVASRPISIPTRWQLLPDPKAQAMDRVREVGGALQQPDVHNLAGSQADNHVQRYLDHFGLAGQEGEHLLITTTYVCTRSAVEFAWLANLVEKKELTTLARIAMGDMINATDSNQVCLVYGDKWRHHRRLMV